MVDSIHNLSKEQLLHVLKTNLAGWNQLRAGFPDYVPNLSKADLSGVNLAGADLRRVNLIRADLSGANLNKADLSRANLISTHLADANLSGALLKESNLMRAVLDRCNLNRVDLSAVNFAQASLVGANLIRVNLASAVLTETNFTEANMVHACLTEAQLEKAILVKANLINADLERANLCDADLSGVTLNEGKLAGANLKRVDLSMADLSWADLSEADLVGAKLRRADLTNADLSGACLQHVDFTGATLAKSDLSEADLIGATLIGADLERAHLERTLFGETLFGNSRLKHAEQLATSAFRGPCGLDHRTLMQSWPLPVAFLQGCGLPDNMIEALAKRDSGYHSCYISFSGYSDRDTELVERLHTDLQVKGIRCWQSPYRSRDQKDSERPAEAGSRTTERVVMVLSSHSMYSEWLKNEVAFLRKQEAKDGARRLFPVSLVDQQEVAEWVCPDPETGVDHAPALREHGILDFSEWRDSDNYSFAIELLRDSLRFM
ncbi:Pentapeptide repeat-containing protein [Sulfidibacter corallicola]|uniref:Pentapeptide repeat-containing protein n=1 Tax=Sulfidibacter corallicola TaxID=2818388 RepID=A0A8A4TDH1_SULCO|nr:pentapeptide repeat-containing protein [Sulfidibacter corallicola]QTD47703.1 pentapeptide repeat-containing protein [Sulfidibacter corallicola]